MCESSMSSMLNSDAEEVAKVAIFLLVMIIMTTEDLLGVIFKWSISPKIK